MQSPGDMRIWPTLVFHVLVLVLVLATSSPAVADIRVVDAPRALTADEIQKELRPLSDQIGRCYMDRTPDVRGAGHLDIVLTVSRHGVVQNIEIKTPGLPAKVAKAIDGCVRDTIAGVSYPRRKDYTVATVPYYFQRTYAPSSGPQYSCWNPSGCSTQAQPTATTSDAKAKLGGAAARRSAYAYR